MAAQNAEYLPLAFPVRSQVFANDTLCLARKLSNLQHDPEAEWALSAITGQQAAAKMCSPDD